jgi:hypothetical protein
MAMRLEGKNCFDESLENRFGSGLYPFDGALSGIDILHGGCGESDRNDVCYYANYFEQTGKLNERCKQSQADSVLMFLTVVLLLVVLALTYVRMKRTY